MGAVAGAGLHMGLVYGGVLGMVLAVLSAAGGLGAALYWIARELLQHDRAWGGKQSQAEWIGPLAVTPVGMAAGYWISWLLL